MKYEKLKLGEALGFWFEELTPEDWFKGGTELDAEIAKRFSHIHAEVAAGEFWRYRTEAHAYLAEIVVLDQFSRQIYRGDKKAFAYDGQALLLAQQAVSLGFDLELEQAERQFLYMPFMHSESKVIHGEAIKLFEALGVEENIKFENIHKDIVDRFERYPHRNKVLGRENTEEETDYLANNHEVFFS